MPDTRATKGESKAEGRIVATGKRNIGKRGALGKDGNTAAMCTVGHIGRKPSGGQSDTRKYLTRQPRILHFQQTKGPQHTPEGVIFKRWEEKKQWNVQRKQFQSEIQKKIQSPKGIKGDHPSRRSEPSSTKGKGRSHPPLQVTRVKGPKDGRRRFVIRKGEEENDSIEHPACRAPTNYERKTK